MKVFMIINRNNDWDWCIEKNIMVVESEKFLDIKIRDVLIEGLIDLLKLFVEEIDDRVWIVWYLYCFFIYFECNLKRGWGWYR